jgi:hypothetical protein
MLNQVTGGKAPQEVESEVQEEQIAQETVKPFDTNELVNTLAIMQKENTTALVNAFNEQLVNLQNQLATTLNESLGGLKEPFAKALEATMQTQNTTKQQFSSKQQEWQDAESKLRSELEQQREITAKQEASLQNILKEHEKLSQQFLLEKEIAKNALMEKQLAEALTKHKVKPVLVPAVSALMRQQLTFKEATNTAFIGEVPVDVAIANWLVTEEGSAFKEAPQTTGGSNVKTGVSDPYSPKVAQSEVDAYFVDKKTRSPNLTKLFKNRHDPVAIEAARQAGVNLSN